MPNIRVWFKGTPQKILFIFCVKKVVKFNKKRKNAQLTLWRPGLFTTSKDQGGSSGPQKEIVIVAHKKAPV